MDPSANEHTASVSLTLLQTELVLGSDATLWVPTEQTLIVADLRAKAFDQGVLSVVQNALELRQAKRLVILGRFLQDFENLSPAEYRLFTDWRSSVAAVEVVMVSAMNLSAASVDGLTCAVLLYESPWQCGALQLWDQLPEDWSEPSAHASRLLREASTIETGHINIEARSRPVLKRTRPRMSLNDEIRCFAIEEGAGNGPGAGPVFKVSLPSVSSLKVGEPVSPSEQLRVFALVDGQIQDILPLRNKAPAIARARSGSMPWGRKAYSGGATRLG